jgi:hypothetical protein
MMSLPPDTWIGQRDLLIGRGQHQLLHRRQALHLTFELGQLLLQPSAELVEARLGGLIRPSTGLGSGRKGRDDEWKAEARRMILHMVKNGAHATRPARTGFATLSGRYAELPPAWSPFLLHL